MKNWILGLIGVWGIIASYLYVPAGSGQVVMFITGLAVAILGFWSAAEMPVDHQRHMMQH